MFYVKAQHVDGATSIYQVESGSVQTGFGFWQDEAPDAKTVLGLSDWKFSAEWRLPHEPTCQYEVDHKPAGDAWELRYAMWIADGLLHAVISPQPIYILGENGKTIDRV